MYKEFYNLSAMPFTISTNPQFLWLGEKHQEALANLKYGLLEADGYVVLTGDVGVGKTTLVNALLADMDESVMTVSLSHPTLATDEFFRFLARSWGAPDTIRGKEQFLFFFKEFLQISRKEGKTVLLIIDEAHRLSAELLEEIRLLSNMETDGDRLLTIFFVGQNELKEILTRQRFRALRQRITLFYNIEPLGLQETGQYIRHRLQVAGGEATLFEREAVRKIYGFTKGYPRLVNILCGRAMLTGYVKDEHHIDASMVTECIEELEFLDPSSMETEEDDDLTNQQRLRQQVIVPNRRQRGDAPFDSDQFEDSRRLSFVARKDTKPAKRRKGWTLTAGLLLTGAAAGILAAHPFWLEKDKWLEKFTPHKWLAVSAGFLEEKTPPRLVALLNARKKPLPVLATSSVDGGSELPEKQERAGDLPEDDSVDDEAGAVSGGGEQPLPAAAETDVEMPGTGAGAEGEAIQASFQEKEAPVEVKKLTPVETKKQSIWELASAALQKNKFQTAIELLESTDTVNLQGSKRYGRLYAKALVGRAELIRNTSQQEAESLLQKAIAASPDYGRASFVLGKIYTDQKRYASAITAYQKAGALDPKLPDSFFNLGFLYAATGMYDNAEKNFMRAVALNPPYIGKALFNLAVVQERLGKRKASLESLRRAKLHSPESTKIQRYMQKILAQEEEKNEES
ncbi:MAG TPA: AAA family ATPase [Desulfopila sp.]|nr:AAA family ATPase [Desulfopila sp.]